MTDVAALPIARVCVDIPLPHLDRLFDYAVPEALAATAVPGTRVRVRFAGRLVDAWVIERVAASDHAGRLAPLAKLVSPVPVLAPEVAVLARAVADRYAGSLTDVLRAAVPPRHARTESAATPSSADSFLPSRSRRTDPGRDAPDLSAWQGTDGGPALLAHLSDVPGPRAVWTSGPGTHWPVALADLAAATDGGVLLIVPDQRDVARVRTALVGRVPDDEVAVLSADLGPSRRYAEFLAIRSGSRRVIVGTRAAALAPVVDLRLAIIWDDGDESHAEPHAPYWHAREVLALRAHQTGCALVIGGVVRTAEAQVLIESGWAKPLGPSRPALRAAMPRIRALDGSAGEEGGRIPAVAWQAAREGLTRGPVLVQVARRDYLPGLACQRCRTRATCRQCSGPLRIPGVRRTPECTWCGRPAADWACHVCSGTAVRATSIGADRTAEELGRAFPGVVVRSSRGDAILDTVPGDPALIIATPGAEPVAEGGYAAVLLLDGVRQLERPGLRATEETARRWFAAAALAASGAAVVVTADSSLPVVQALIRWDPAGLARREVAQRRDLGLPPVSRVAVLTGSTEAMAALIESARLPGEVRVLGPVPIEPTSRRRGVRGADVEPDPDTSASRTVLMAPRAAGASLARALKEAAALRSVRRGLAPVEIRMDPPDL